MKMTQIQLTNHANMRRLVHVKHYLLLETGFKHTMGRYIHPNGRVVVINRDYQKLSLNSLINKLKALGFTNTDNKRSQVQ